MKKILLLLLLVLGFSSCSAKKEAKIVLPESAVPRSNAIIIAGISFIDDFDDPEDMVKKRVNSIDLLKDSKRIASSRKWVEKPDLHTPLYYISDLQLLLKTKESKEEKVYTLKRFNLNLNEYEYIAIFQIEPGSYSWYELALDQYRFDDSNNKEPVRWQQFPSSYPINSPDWNFEAGKVYYIGDIQFFFETKKFRFGLVPRESLVEKIELTQVLVQDKFEETKKLLIDEKPWFPTTEITQSVTTKEYIVKDGEIIEGKIEEKKKIKKIERDKTKFFF